MAQRFIAATAPQRLKPLILWPLYRSANGAAPPKDKENLCRFPVLNLPMTAHLMCRSDTPVTSRMEAFGWRSGSPLRRHLSG